MYIKIMKIMVSASRPAEYIDIEAGYRNINLNGMERTLCKHGQLVRNI